MSVINVDSFQEGLPSALLIFESPITQTAAIKSGFQEIRPLSQIANGARLEFNISIGSLSYLDLSSSQLYVKLKVTKGDGNALQA